MNQWLTHLLQVVMAVSLLAMPTPAISCPVPATTAQTDACCCCGSSSSCPKDTVCTHTASPTDDRTVSHVQPKIPSRLAIMLVAFIRDNESLSVPTAKLSKQEAIPPPLVIGSPPQAKLRVWLI